MQYVFAYVIATEVWQSLYEILSLNFNRFLEDIRL